jgi:membrane-associated phospholipid phosphatase
MSVDLAVRRRRVVAWQGAILAAIVFAASWVLVLPDEVGGIEEWVFRAVNGLPDWLEGPSWLLMQLGALAAVPIVAFLVYIVWRRWQPALAIIGGGSAAWLLAKLVKEFVERGRPQAYLADVHLRPDWEGFGYVSGHAAVVFAMATIVAPSLNRVGKLLVWAGAVATCLLRMYVGAHLPLDVIGGAALGVMVGSVARRLVAGIDDPAGEATP